MTEKNEYLQKMDLLLNSLDAETGRLRTGFGGNPKWEADDLDRWFRRLECKRKTARAKFGKLKHSPGRYWGEDSRLFLEAYLDFQDVYLSFRSKVLAGRRPHESGDF